MRLPPTLLYLAIGLVIVTGSKGRTTPGYPFPASARRLSRSAPAARREVPAELELTKPAACRQMRMHEAAGAA
jgi:hypothetical protein